MSDINYIENSAIENFLGMNIGYIMDFTTDKLQEFVIDVTGCDILSEKYKYRTNSNVNRLRRFMKIESNYLNGCLLSAFCDLWASKLHVGEFQYGLFSSKNRERFYNECIKIADRLKEQGIVDHLDIIRPNSDDKNFELLAKSIKESIEKNEPEVALDRLHTFVIKYFRQLSDNHGINHNKDEPLNSLFGKYIKYLDSVGQIDSKMTEKILKYSISIMDAFNDVRNNKSFAHDNKILNYEESILIFNNITSTLKFIDVIENKIKN